VNGDAQELIAALTAENTDLRRDIERERRIRHEAEAIAEQGLRELYNRQRELEFLSHVTSMANQAGSAREVLANALEYIARFAGWPAAHAFIVGGIGSTRRMWPSNIWYCDPETDLTGLRAATMECVYTEGAGLPGRVWASGKPVWIDDLATRTDFPRRDSALQSGLRCAFSVPVVVGSEVTASLEFFGPDPLPEDPALLSLIAEAGTQLGRVIERDSARARLRDAMHDSLTGLPSRPGFVQKVEQALREYSLDHSAGFCGCGTA